MTHPTASASLPSTERSNPHTAELDTLPTLALVQALQTENHSIATAVDACLPTLAQLVDAAYKGFKRQGRLIYVGAGTSGRLGVLDASECPPTYGVPAGKVLGVIAGGDTALTHAVEGAEDDANAGQEAMHALKLTFEDTVVGVSASGNAPYVVAALQVAKAVGCVTGGIANSANSLLEAVVDYSLIAITGAEPITGSTRMKAGTAQKMLLNHISTSLMVLLGKTYGNLMVDVRASNHKLRQRAIRLVCQLTPADEAEATELLKACDWEVKTAIVMRALHGTATHARDALAHHQGRLRATLDSLPACRG
ncbi:MAG: N-acetylmuramic acid 6-phosphate etherase [Vampirovibrionales bacterium]